MTRVYVLTGSTGEYSDHTSWVVAVYADREQAEAHKAALDALVGVQEAGTDADYDTRTEAARRVQAAELDPQCAIDYTGTTYEVTEYQLFRHLDEYKESL